MLSSLSVSAPVFVNRQSDTLSQLQSLQVSIPDTGAGVLPPASTQQSGQSSSLPVGAPPTPQAPHKFWVDPAHRYALSQPSRAATIVQPQARVVQPLSQYQYWDPSQQHLLSVAQPVQATASQLIVQPQILQCGSVFSTVDQCDGQSVVPFFYDVEG